MKKVKNDLTGKTFGRLYVIGVDDNGKRKTSYICQCSCGNIKSIRSDALLGGVTVSCGCKKREQDKINLTANHSHKMSGSRIYGIWLNMKDRCNNPNNARYCRYGGRGIRVCQDWEHDFQAFYDWSIANGYGENLTIDRIDNSGNYDPSNCRWTDVKTQCNNRDSNIKITIGNTTKTLTQWCEIFSLEYKKIVARYHRNENQTLDELFKGGD